MDPNRIDPRALVAERVASGRLGHEDVSMLGTQNCRLFLTSLAKKKKGGEPGDRKKNIKKNLRAAQFAFWTISRPPNSW